MELILKAKDIRVEFKGRDVLDINELEVYDYDRIGLVGANGCLLYTSPSPRDLSTSRMPSSA